MESIEELMLISGSIIILGLLLVYVLPNITSFAGMYKGEAISTIILNSFKLASPIASSGEAIIYDNGYPTTLLVSITAYNSISRVPLENTYSSVVHFVSGPNIIPLPVVSGNAYYKISLYSSDGSVLYKSFYIDQYSTNYVEISNIINYVNVYLDGSLLNLQQTNSTAYLYLPDGTYSLDIYSPYYFYKYNFGFPQNQYEDINLPLSFIQYTIPVYQMLPGKNLQPLPGAIISLNNNSATYKTGSSGTANILYTSNAPVEMQVTCPPNICGTGITNNYTSFYNVSPISKYQMGTSTPIILYPLYRTIFNEQIICNGSSYPTPGTITILANPTNQTMNRYGTVNASGQFITYLYAGSYNVTGSTLSGMFNKTTANIIKQNQTFDVNFTYCVVHIPTNSIIFKESGLPTNTLWNVTYAGVYNQSTNSIITFNGLLNENYTFSIPNITIGRIVYQPSPSSGSSYPGKIINVKFIPVIYYVPITLSNQQSNSTPTPFQQMITVNSNNYTKYEASGLQNVEFSTAPGGQGSVLNAWIESGNSNTSTSTVYWVKLPNGIGASSSNTIYMNFMPYNVMSSNGPTGEAPQLSPIYAQYDDGANVFNIYADFSGTALPSGWTAVSGTSGTDYIINNGLQLETTTARIQGPSVTQNFILEGYFQFISDALNGWDFGVYSSSSSAYGFHPDGNGNTNNWVYTYYYNNYYNNNAYNPYSWINYGSTIGNGYYFIWQLINNAGSITTNFDNPSYITIYSALFTNPLSGAPITLGERFDNTETGQDLNVIFYWVRVRAYPPNGVMPGVSIGSIQHT